MNLDEFIEKYEGKYVEVAGSANALNQCVDCANSYFREVLGVPIVEWTNAKDFPKKVSDEDFEWIPNTLRAVPEKGDVMIWDCYGCGHIAIYFDGDVNNFVSFDQNWPVGSPCHLQGHDYWSVTGWLRPKKEPMADALTECLAQHTHLVDECNKKDREIESLNSQFEDLNEEVERERKDKEKAQKDLVLANNAKTVADLRVKVLESELSTLSELLNESTSSNLELNRQIDKLETDLAECLASDVVQVDPIITRIINFIKKLFGR